MPPNHQMDMPRDPSGPGTRDQVDEPTQPADPSQEEGARKKSEESGIRWPEKPPAVSGYELLSKLGKGTYGEVWLAKEEKTGIQVAIKFFAHGTGPQWQLLQAEVKQLAQLHGDPGIVQLEDVDVEADPPYYVMAYARQGSLARRLEGGPLPVAEAVELFRQAATAIAYVHAKGIRHCDLKPGNILLDARGRALVADFGQAHLSSDASPTLGTFFYMAPEQADLTRQIPDTRWDVYGLGAILYALLTGRPPRENAPLRNQLEQTAELSHRLLRYREAVRSAPKPAGHRRVRGVDRPLAAIIDRCLELDPEQRFRDAGAVLDALAGRERQRRQQPFLVFGLVATVLGLVVLTLLALWAEASAIEEAKVALATNLLNQDEQRAGDIADSIDDDIGTFQKKMEAYARDRKLIDGLLTGKPNQMRESLREFYRAHREQSQGWVVVGADGWDVASWSEQFEDEFPSQAHQRGWCGWRDYFWGKGDQHEFEKPSERFPESKTQPPSCANPPFVPISAKHISHPYRSRIRPNGPADGPCLIGVSAPIRSDPQGQVLGVLVATIELEKLRSWPAHSRQNSLDGIVVLVNDRGYCLLHEGAKDDVIVPLSGAPRPLDCEYFKKARGEADGGTVRSYKDPVTGKEHLAGYAPSLKTGWGVLVQHDLEAVDRLADEMTRAISSRLKLVGLVSLVVVSLLLSGLWGWIMWTLRRGEGIAHA